MLFYAGPRGVERFALCSGDTDPVALPRAIPPAVRRVSEVPRLKNSRFTRWRGEGPGLGAIPNHPQERLVRTLHGTALHAGRSGISG